MEAPRFSACCLACTAPATVYAQVARPACRSTTTEALCFGKVTAVGASVWIPAGNGSKLLLRLLCLLCNACAGTRCVQIHCSMSIQNLSMQGVAVRAPVRFPLAVVAAAVSLISASTVMASEARVSETIVTATRTETKLDETMADVRVITKEQISSSGGRSLAEILQRFAGAQIVSYGGRGQLQNISFRGSKQVVLLVDGVRFSSATAGEPSLALLPLELIERIEVVHGPASALYGSDAIGGVVQIFTKRGLSAQNSFSPSASVTYGHAGYKDIQGALLGKHNEWDYSIAANRVIDPKFSVTNAKEPWGSFEADLDSFHQTGINASLGYKINQDWRFESTLTSAVSRVDLDSDGKINPWDENSYLTAQIKLKGNLLPSWRSSFAISSMEDDQSSYSVGVVNPSYYKTNQYEYSWFNEFDTPWVSLLQVLID